MSIDYSMNSRALDRCKQKAKHTKSPTGYLAWHEWADQKSKHHYQIKCPGCGLYAIWKRKPKQA